jgi:putative transposase
VGGRRQVKRRFKASAPNRLWLADLTYVRTSTGWVYVAFIVDVYSRMIVGWQASRSLRTDLAIDALQMAIYNRGRTDSLQGLIHHSDRGVQPGFKGSKQHFAVERTLGVRPWLRRVSSSRGSCVADC